ncbi:uncharacterized protein [Nicotiana tomentosiformis]|uniref:uncharacterized protein n=1 Tax=Nicotiana tomentosiformis TaxID=4098 RepID=UPI0014481C63|nr:uncharacterized protein LOC117273749 [Nicotiana tomentosiformis]
MARTIILKHSLPNHFWAEAVSTTCHILNSYLIRPTMKKTPYELWKGKRPNIGYFHPFGSKCIIHNNSKDNLGKFDSRSDEGDPSEGIKTRGALKKKANVALISQIEPKKVEEALKDSSWVQAMHEELDQFDKNQVWKLLSKPADATVIGTKRFSEISSTKMERLFQSAPKESHLTAVKRIIHYFIGTISYGLWYPRSNNFKLEGFSDADLTCDKEDRKSTSRTCQLLEKALISWSSKKQGSVALSITEAEYIAIGQCCA